MIAAKFKMLFLGAALAGLSASLGPAEAYYYYRHYDPGPAVALGFFSPALGALADAAIALQGGYYAYGPPAYYYPPPVRYYAPCLPGFFWRVYPDGNGECWPWPQ